MASQSRRHGLPAVMGEQGGSMSGSRQTWWRGRGGLGWSETTRRRRSRGWRWGHSSAVSSSRGMVGKRGRRAALEQGEADGVLRRDGEALERRIVGGVEFAGEGNGVAMVYGRN